MKILQIAKYYPPVKGGIETVVSDITENLNQKGISCDVICSNIENKYIEEKKEKYRIYRTKTIGHIFATAISFQFILKLRSIIKNYDIVHLHHPNPLGTIALFFSSPTKIVVHWHCDIVRQKVALFFFKPLQTWLLKKCDSIIVTSPNYLASSTPLQDFKRKAEIIPIGIDPEKYRSLVQGKSKKISGRNIIFTLGRLISYKGYEYLIEAATFLDDDFIILIGGNGPLRFKLEHLVKKHGVQNKVQLLGHLSDKETAEWFHACKIFCLPSVEKNEAFGVVLLEAMSFGKPLLTTSINGSGIGWVNKNGFTGITVPPRNSKAIATAAKDICNGGNYEDYSANAYRRLNENFLKEKMINKIVQLYNGI